MRDRRTPNRRLPRQLSRTWEPPWIGCLLQRGRCPIPRHPGLRQSRSRVSADSLRPPRVQGSSVMAIKVLLVDDHAVFRSGLRRILTSEGDIEVVGEAKNGERAVFEAIANAPDIVVMDVQMPGKSGIEAMPAVLQAVPAARVLVLSMQDDPRYVRQAFDA